MFAGDRPRVCGLTDPAASRRPWLPRERSRHASMRVQGYPRLPTSGNRRARLTPGAPGTRTEIAAAPGRSHPAPTGSCQARFAGGAAQQRITSVLIVRGSRPLDSPRATRAAFRPCRHSPFPDHEGRARERETREGWRRPPACRALGCFVCPRLLCQRALPRLGVSSFGRAYRLPR